MNLHLVCVSENTTLVKPFFLPLYFPSTTLILALYYPYADYSCATIFSTLIRPLYYSYATIMLHSYYPYTLSCAVLTASYTLTKGCRYAGPWPYVTCIKRFRINLSLSSVRFRYGYTTAGFEAF